MSSAFYIWHDQSWPFSQNVYFEDNAVLELDRCLMVYFCNNWFTLFGVHSVINLKQIPLKGK